MDAAMTYDYVGEAFMELVAAVRANNRLPIEARTDSTVTICSKKGTEEFIVLRGSAQNMAPRFVQLFRERPELAGVVRDVLNGMYRIVDTPE